MVKLYEELLETYGWNSIPSKNPYMKSFAKDDMRLNVYSNATITVQWDDNRKMMVQKEVSDEQLEDILIQYQ